MSKFTIKTLLADLDGFAQPIPLDALVERLQRLEITIRDVRKYVRFGADCYKRNSMHIGPAYQALILCWRSGQRSPIHDHNGSACGVRVIEGVGTEVLFAESACGLISPTESRALTAGSVCGSFDSDVHQMGNLQPAGRDLVTLHVYSPPLLAMRTYFLGNAVLGEDDAVVRRVIRARASRLKRADAKPASATSASPASAGKVRRSLAGSSRSA